jgi:hypothetical protein
MYDLKRNALRTSYSTCVGHKLSRCCVEMNAFLTILNDQDTRISLSWWISILKTDTGELFGVHTLYVL